jgi:AraC-like DNA-binding protein
MSGDVSTFHFTTRPFAPEQRQSIWQETMAGVVRRAMSPLSDHPFNAEMTVHRLGAANDPAAPSALTIVRGRVTQGGVAQRTREFLADGNDQLVLHIQEAGPRTLRQLDREHTIGPGEGVLSSNSDVSAMWLPQPTRFSSVALPRALLCALAPRAENMVVRPLGSGSGVLRLLLRYLDILDEQQALQAPPLRDAVAVHIRDLCALAIGAARDAAELAEGRGLRAARLRAVKADITQHLTDPALSPGAIARRQQVTPRYLHKLFEHEGTTLSHYVLGLRLLHAHRMLLDATRAPPKVSEVAYATGFNDLSTFNREFRRRFGATPSEVRAAAGSASGARRLPAP